jgi:anti-anti-sigma regulatory factor
MPETTILIFADNMCHKFSIFSSIFTHKSFFFSFSAVPTIDTSGIAFLIDLKKATEKHGLEVYSSYISQAVNLVM